MPIGYPTETRSSRVKMVSEKEGVAMTEKQRLFVAEYLVDRNATKAAIRAGYSPRTAYSIGSENLTKPEIKKAIQDKLDHIEDELGITRDRILREYRNIAFSDITDYVQLEKTEAGINVVFKPTESLTLDQRRALQSIRVTQSGIDIKTHDKHKALEFLAAYLGMVEQDKQDVEYNITLDGGSQEYAQ